MVCLITWLNYYLVVLLAVSTLNATILLWGNIKFRYYACYLSYMVTTSVVSLMYVPLLPFMLVGNNINVYFTTLPAKIFSKIIGIKWEVRGSEHLDKNKPAIVTASHQTMFDILGLFILGTALRNMVVVARNALFYVFPLGLLFWLSGSVVYIDNRAKSNGTTLENLFKVLYRVKNNKMKMIFFPEGTRNVESSSLLPFKKGAFKLAIESQLQIIPIVFSPYYFIDHQKKIFQKGNMIISVLPPIQTKGSSLLDLDKIIEKTKNIMEEEFKKLKLELEPKKT